MDCICVRYLSQEHDVLSIRPDDIVDLISDVSPRQVGCAKACLHTTKITWLQRSYQQAKICHKTQVTSELNWFPVCYVYLRIMFTFHQHCLPHLCSLVNFTAAEHGKSRLESLSTRTANTAQTRVILEAAHSLSQDQPFRTICRLNYDSLKDGTIWSIWSIWLPAQLRVKLF